MKFASSFFRCFHPSITLATDAAEDKEEEDVQVIRSPNLRVFSYNELKAATQGFKNKIGEGGFGSVYKAWELYSANNLLELMDSVLVGDFSREEAVRFLKIGLLCVQETTKLRPKMSTAVKMLTNEIDTEDVEITQPGLVSDLMQVKIRRKHSSNFTASPASSSTTGSFQAR
ncbi:hypothetical protein BUALT_Bualt09G0074700 [Buddleja alternifolia]|uniref:Uncharacterized protein n=1 Tax=Buddleja alternifolia TaxID=168488 RepID=A0AAV6X817_9LAMI|nr:hypothetical protein BUALT_Bualt09G0074700 [Buddleja alternifolia]